MHFSCLKFTHLSCHRTFGTDNNVSSEFMDFSTLNTPSFPFVITTCASSGKKKIDAQDAAEFYFL